MGKLRKREKKLQRQEEEEEVAVQGELFEEEQIKHPLLESELAAAKSDVAEINNVVRSFLRRIEEVSAIGEQAQSCDLTATSSHVLYQMRHASERVVTVGPEQCRGRNN